MAVVLGASILRRRACLVAVRGKGKSLAVTLERLCERPPGSSASDILGTLLSGIPSTDRDTTLAVALSSDLACSDAWSIPQAWKGTAQKVGPALVEARCPSESLENLVLDAFLDSGGATAVAIDRAQAVQLLETVRSFKCVTLTAVPAALAQVFGDVSLSQGGERLDVTIRERRPAWRAYPIDGPDEAGSLAWNGLEIPAEQAAAFAAAVCDPDAVPNLLKAFPQHRKTFLKRFRDPLLNVGAAAALCLGAFGVQFHRDAVRERDELAAARRAEMELWGRLLPSDSPREGRLLKTMRDRLADLGETSGAADIPSALAFWGEIGRQMPDPEALGLTLESLDLAPDGGRLSARVPATKDDPLKNASQLETRLNQSKKLATRGDYEVREGQVQVRLRMDYRP